MVSCPGPLARVVTTAVLLLLGGAPAMASELVCKPNYDFCVEVNGAFPTDARFFNSQERGKFFIDIPSSKDGLLMDLQAKKMYAVPRGQIAPDNDGLKVQDGLSANMAAYAFSIDGPIVECQAEDKKIRVMPVLKRPPVIGPIAIDALIADRSEYRAGMKAYSPDKTKIGVLSKCQKPVELEVYFATWCPHCKLYMPKLLRVVKDANNPNIKTTLVGMPQMWVGAKGAWEDKNIQTIPTVIVKIDGREITRMGTHEGALPEDELAGIIQAVK